MNLTPANLKWSGTNGAGTGPMKNFEVQWKVLSGKKDESDPETPKLTKALTAMKWAESFSDVMHRCVGSRTIPLAYVLRKDEVPEPAVAPVASAGKPHAAEYVSIEEELIARATHTHPLYRDDNAALYFKLEESLRGTVYHPTILKFQKTKNGRSAYFALINAHAGDDKWNAEIERCEDLLHNFEWKGENNFSLEKHIQNHRNAAITLEAAAEHITYQVPNEYMLIGYLLNSIKSHDPELHAAMTEIKADKDPNGKRFKMDKAIEELQPADPGARKRKDTKRSHFADVSGMEANISDTVVSKSSTVRLKNGIGRTGVHFRFYEDNDYRKLSSEQKKELKVWRQSPEGKAAVAAERGKSVGRRSGKRKHGKDQRNNQRASIESVVELKLTARLKTIECECEHGKHLNVLLAALDNKMTSKTNGIVSATNVPPTNEAMVEAKKYLSSLLAKSKNT